VESSAVATPSGHDFDDLLSSARWGGKSLKISGSAAAWAVRIASGRESAVRTSSVIVGCLVAVNAVHSAFAIEAVRGKNYTLTRQHGPWMIMVASFRDVPKDRREEGLSAEEAALELVYELREKGIPAYTYGQDAKVAKIDTVDRLGRDDERVYAAQRDMICVLAGNYKAIDDQDSNPLLKGEASKATATLAWVKKFQPKFMQGEKSGAILRQTPGRKGPLSGAFLTINPMLNPEEVASRKADTLILALNEHSNYPLSKCPGKYTVQVATFTGKKATPIGTSIYKNNEAKFDQSLKDKASYSLNRAGEDAEQLAATLRQKGYEAFVYHDHFQSIVTVGAYSAPNDPRAATIIQNFGAKVQFDSTAGREVLTAEVVRLPNPGSEDFAWILDPQPKVVAVPRK
jgi:hypothetical protein